MSAAEDLVNNTPGVAENPVNHSTGATGNPINDKEGATENPIKDKGVIENPINVKADSADNPVINKAAGAENPVSDEAGGAENPANDQSDSAVNPVNDQAGGVQDPANGQSDGAVNPVNDQAGGAENPANDQSDGAVNPVNDQAGGAEDTANDQLDGAVNPVNNQAGGAENLLNDLADVAENPLNEQAGSAEIPVTDQADVAENPVNDQADGAENPVNDRVDVAENPVNDQAGSAANDQASGIEKSAYDQAGGAENPVNDKSGAAENAINDKAGTSENALNDKAGGVENPVNDKADGVENPVSKQADATEGPVNDEEDGEKNLIEDEEDAVETPVNNKVDRLPEEAKEILKSLAGKWENVLDANTLQVIPLKGAMTNEVYQIKWPTTAGESSRKVVVRIYGEGVDVFFDRGDEIRTFEFMSKNGQGPRLLGRFTNGRVEEFIHARTLSASDLRDPSISVLIAAKMKEFHDLHMPGEKKVHLWDTLRNWLSEAKRVSSPKEVEAFYLDTIDKEISILEKELSGAHQKIGFCHNDLQYGNIMLDEETNSVTIIDYEYASYNPVAYDIANHFCEMAANYHTDEPHILDYNKYPDFEERQRFVKAYLSSSGEQPSESEVEQLLQEVEKYTLANHLFWGVWGIISAQVNKIDFDYKEYAKQRFQEYWARKPYLLISSDAPSPYNVPEGTGDLASALPTKGSSTKTGIFRKMKKVLGLGLFKSKS